MSTRQGNILDPIHAELDPRVWDEPASPRPKLKPKHVHWIKNEIYTTLQKGGYTDVENWLSLVFTGSLTTYQYSEESDCDVSLFVDTKVFPDWSRAEMIALMVEKLDGRMLPGTPFPMQDFVVAQGIKPSDLYKPGLRSGYSLDTLKWIVPPERDRAHDVKAEQGGFYAWALQIADKMEMLLRYEPDKALELWHSIHHKRRRDMAKGKGDYAESNIIYKMLAQRGLFPALSDASGEYIAHRETPHDSSDREDHTSPPLYEEQVAHEKMMRSQTPSQQDRDDGRRGTSRNDHIHIADSDHQTLSSIARSELASEQLGIRSLSGDSARSIADHTGPPWTSGIRSDTEHSKVADHRDDSLNGRTDRAASQDDTWSISSSSPITSRSRKQSAVPSILYHETKPEFAESIEREGLLPKHDRMALSDEEKGVWLTNLEPTSDKYYPERPVYEVDARDLPLVPAEMEDLRHGEEWYWTGKAIPPERLKRLPKLEDATGEYIAKTGAGQDTQDFFTQAESGNRAPLQPLLPEDVSQDPEHQRIYAEQQRYFGPFDRHIETSIPDWRNNSLDKTRALLSMGGGKLLAIGGGTGSFGKALTSLSNGAWETDNLEPNAEMQRTFRQHPVPGSNLIPAAFAEHVNGLPIHEPRGAYDVAHESMGFQFMHPDRRTQIHEAKRFLKPGGLLLSEEKFHVPNEAENERVKDEWKSKYYTPEALADKNREVGFQGQGPMVDNLVHRDDYEKALKEHFLHVAPYWQSGNFAGYAASDSRDRLNAYLSGLKRGEAERTAKTAAGPSEWFAPSYMVPDDAKHQIHEWAHTLAWPLGARMNPHHRYHVTGLYSPTGYLDADHHHWVQSKSGITYPVQTTGLESFSAGDKGHPVVLRVHHPQMTADTEALMNEGEERGLPVSRFPGGYKAHITLGYSPTPVEAENPNMTFNVGPLHELHSLYDSEKTAKTARRKPPHLRGATGKQRCSTCWAFEDGKCAMFDGYPVQADETCDDWESVKTKTSGLLPAKVLYNKFRPDPSHPNNLGDEPTLPFVYDPDSGVVHLGPAGAFHFQLIDRTPELRDQYAEAGNWTQPPFQANPHHVHGAMHWPSRALKFFTGTGRPEEEEVIREALGAPSPTPEEGHRWEFTSAVDVSEIAKRVWQSAMDGSGITINVHGEPPRPRYGFAPNLDTQTSIPLKSFTPDMVEEFIDKFRDRLQDPEKFIGAWIQGDNVVLDVTESHDDFNTAFERAWNGHQQSLWDSQIDDEIPVRGLDYVQPTQRESAAHAIKLDSDVIGWGGQRAYWPVCSCGWMGTEQMVGKVAMDEGQMHKRVAEGAERRVMGDG